MNLSVVCPIAVRVKIRVSFGIASVYVGASRSQSHQVIAYFTKKTVFQITWNIELRKF